MSKNFPTRQKLLLLAACAAAGIAAYLAAFAYFYAGMTPWQREQPIDFDAQTGSTKFKAHIDAAAIGGAAFCVSAVAITTAARLRRLKK